jgi:hypothetical protein
MADGSGAWWFRYLLLNPGQLGCTAEHLGKPVQVWATWFPRDDAPRTFIQGFDLDSLALSPRNTGPFYFRVGQNAIDESSCRGHLVLEGHEISWDLHYTSTFQVNLSSKGWIGFTRTPHSNAVFHGTIRFDDRIFNAQPLGYGLQGHNCGYKHRSLWRWGHAYLPGQNEGSTLEALTYDMPLGLMFRKAVLWHSGRPHDFTNIRDAVSTNFTWNLHGKSRDGYQLHASIDGATPGIHRLPYLRTDCSGTFDVTNNSLANAHILLLRNGSLIAELETTGGAVLEFGGKASVPA